jgi:hypothetical protein
MVSQNGLLCGIVETTRLLLVARPAGGMLGVMQPDLPMRVWQSNTLSLTSSEAVSLARGRFPGLVGNDAHFAVGDDVQDTR